LIEEDMNLTLRKAIVAAAIAWPLGAQAGGLYLYEIGTSDLGFAGAGTAARAEDASTVYANPAGMTRLNGNQMTLGGQALYGKAEYQLDGQGLLTGSNPGNIIGWVPGGSAFYSYSVSDKLKLGFGFYGNYGLALDFGNGWAGRNLAGEMALMALTLQPTVAYRLDEQWSLGAGLKANYGIMKLTRVALVGGSTLEQKDTDWSYGARLGVMYEPSKTTRFGLVWDSESELNFNINPTVTGILGRTHTLPFGANTPMPQQIMGSAYHRLNDRWAIMGNLGWQDWSRYSSTTLEANGTTVTSSLKVRDTWHAAFGAQYTLDSGTRLNAGVAYDTSMYKDQSKTSFALPSGAAWRLGAGLQYALSPKADLGFAMEYSRSESSSDPSALLSGKYDHPSMFVMSVHYTHRF
jgi:long-chain fatty acid transport protein